MQTRPYQKKGVYFVTHFPLYSNPLQPQSLDVHVGEAFLRHLLLLVRFLVHLPRVCGVIL